MFFGGHKGFNAFYPKDIKQDTYKSPVVITDFLLFNVPVHLKERSILYTPKITLDYTDYIMSFEFIRISNIDNFTYFNSESSTEGFNIIKPNQYNGSIHYIKVKAESVRKNIVGTSTSISGVCEKT